MILTSMRGGSTEEEEMVDEDEEEEEEEIDEEEEEDEEDEEEEDDDDEATEKMPKIASMEPVRLIISTNWGNSLIDQTVELTPARTRDVASLKKSLSKQLPGRPPIIGLDLVYEGRILEDETLVDELFEDDEDEEDEDDEDEIEEGNEPTRRLTLNLVPPVDPKFATELGPKLIYTSEEDDDYIGVAADPDAPTADELVDAFYMNQVAMSRNAQLLADPNMESSAFMRMELQEQAQQLRDQLQAETPAEVWEKCMKVPDPASAGKSQEEWKGQRYRSTKGGVSRQLKTVIQTNLNVEWENAIKHSLLFLFLGYFGGKNSFSRHLLLWGAPLSFALQARPVKIWFKIIFYMLSNPPLILLSFLPAPQQAILSVDMRASCVALYGEDGANAILGEEMPSRKQASTISSDEEEEESDVDEESEVEEDEYDSEEEVDEDDESDEE